MNWELTIAGAGLLLGVFNALAWWIERRDRLAEMADEREARQAGLAIERERLRMDIADREALKHAEITARQDGFSRPKYYFVLTNLGPSWAKHISAWLQTDEGAPLTPSSVTRQLERGQEHRIEFDVPEVAWRTPYRVTLWVKWFDDSGGPYEEPSNLEVNFG